MIGTLFRDTNDRRHAVVPASLFLLALFSGCYSPPIMSGAGEAFEPRLSSSSAWREWRKGIYAVTLRSYGFSAKATGDYYSGGRQEIVADSQLTGGIVAVEWGFVSAKTGRPRPFSVWAGLLAGRHEIAGDFGGTSNEFSGDLFDIPVGLRFDVALARDVSLIVEGTSSIPFPTMGGPSSSFLAEGAVLLEYRFPAAPKWRLWLGHQSARAYIHSDPWGEDVEYTSALSGVVFGFGFRPGMAVPKATLEQE
jgi:hypothetical protein